MKDKKTEVVYVFSDDVHWQKPNALLRDEDGQWFLGWAEDDNDPEPNIGEPVTLPEALDWYCVSFGYSKGGESGSINPLIQEAANAIARGGGEIIPEDLKEVYQFDNPKDLRDPLWLLQDEKSGAFYLANEDAKPVRASLIEAMEWFVKLEPLTTDATGSLVPLIRAAVKALGERVPA